ncbi:MAG: hypothetical protein RLN62_06795 [Rickettsiales bacterium]
MPVRLEDLSDQQRKVVSTLAGVVSESKSGSPLDPGTIAAIQGFLLMFEDSPIAHRALTEVLEELTPENKELIFPSEGAAHGGGGDPGCAEGKNEEGDGKSEEGSEGSGAAAGGGGGLADNRLSGIFNLMNQQLEAGRPDEAANGCIAELWNAFLDDNVALEPAAIRAIVVRQTAGVENQEKISIWIGRMLDDAFADHEGVAVAAPTPSSTPLPTPMPFSREDGEEDEEGESDAVTVVTAAVSPTPSPSPSIDLRVLEGDTDFVPQQGGFVAGVLTLFGDGGSA